MKTVDILEYLWYLDPPWKSSVVEKGTESHHASNVITPCAVLASPLVLYVNHLVSWFSLSQCFIMKSDLLWSPNLFGHQSWKKALNTISNREIPIDLHKFIEKITYQIWRCPKLPIYFWVPLNHLLKNSLDQQQQQQQMDPRSFIAWMSRYRSK